MSKHVKNDSGATDKWEGQVLIDAEIYKVQIVELEEWAREARTSGSKIETDILSGDLKVSDDGFVTTLSSADALTYMQGFNADCIRNTIVDDLAKADKKQLCYDAASKKIVYMPSVYNFLLSDQGDLLVDQNFNFLTNG